MSRRILVTVLLAAILALPAVLAGCAATPSHPRPAPETTTQSVKVGRATRTWVQIAPPGAAAARVPIIVVLSGKSATVRDEMARDGLLPLPSSGRAELVYPSAVGRSWNAGDCCGPALARHVDDVGFLTELIARVDPGHRRPIYLTGYSNGGQLAYLIACTSPSLVSGFAVVKATPAPGCEVTRPLDLLQIDSTNDWEVPYRPGDPGDEPTAATTQVARLRAVDGCTGPMVASRGTLRLTTWSHCRANASFTFALYQGGLHQWPPGDATTPSAAALIWNFIKTINLP
jgi:polyhydroxybutyrate depolymerase